MKKYTITYYTIAGLNRSWDTTVLFEFHQRLSELLEDRYVIQDSIVFRTENIVNVLINKSVVSEPTKEEQEYINFKLGK